MKGFLKFKELFLISFNTLRRELKENFLILFGLFSFSYLTCFLGYFFEDSESILYLLLKFILMIMPIFLIVKIIQKEELKYSRPLHYSSTVLTFFLASLVFSLLFVLGLVIFIIPGLVALGCLTYMPMVAVFEDRGILETIKRSIFLSRKDLVLSFMLGFFTLLLELFSESTGLLTTTAVRFSIGGIISIFDALMTYIFTLISVKAYYYLRSLEGQNSNISG